MEQPKRKKQRTLTEMYPKPGDSNNNRNPEPKVAIDPPVPFRMFKKMVQNLPAIVSKYNQHKATSSLDTGEQFYRDFYSNPEVRKLYPLNIKPCPSYLRNKLLQIPDESKQNPIDEEFVRPTNSSIKRKRKKQRSKKTYIYPVTFETFKEYLDHEALMTDLLWRVSKKNEEEYNRIKNDEQCYERTLRLYYNTFYLQPERRNEYNYMFKETSPEMLQKLLSHAVLQDDKKTSKTDNKTDREKFEKSEIILEKTNSIDDKLIRREHKINSSFTSEYLDRESRELVTDEMFSKACNYDVFIEQAELINERLMFPITESKLKNFLVNFDEIYSEIARRNPFVTTEISTIVFHEFYRLFYLFPEFRSFYNCRYKICPLMVKQNILESPTNLDYSGILFPITISTFKEFVNYEEVLDKLIKTVVAKDEKEFSKAKNDEKLCQRIFEAYYYSYYLSPHIVRVLFSHKSEVADENFKSKFFDMPILRPANDGDAICRELPAVDNNNPISQTRNVHNAQDTTNKRRRSDFDFPVSVRIFKEYINYNYVMDAVVKNYVKNDESKFMKLRQDTNFCKKQLDIFYNNFYLNKNFRKKYQVTFKNAPPELQDKLWKFAITKKKSLTDVIEILNNDEKNLEETTGQNLCRQQSFQKMKIDVVNYIPCNIDKYITQMKHKINFDNMKELFMEMLEVGHPPGNKETERILFPNVFKDQNIEPSPQLFENESEKQGSYNRERTQSPVPPTQINPTQLPEVQTYATNPIQQLFETRMPETERGIDGFNTSLVNENNYSIPETDHNYSTPERNVSNLLTENFVNIGDVANTQSQSSNPFIASDPLQELTANNIEDTPLTSTVSNNLATDKEIKQEKINLLNNLYFIMDSESSRGYKCDVLNESVIIIDDDSTVSDKDLQLLCIDDESRQLTNTFSTPIDVTSSASATECDALTNGQLFFINTSAKEQTSGSVECTSNECSENSSNKEIETETSENLIIDISHDDNSQPNLLEQINNHKKSNKSNSPRQENNVTFLPSACNLLCASTKEQTSIENVKDKINSECLKTNLAIKKATKGRLEQLSNISKRPKLQPEPVPQLRHVFRPLTMCYLPKEAIKDVDSTASSSVTQKDNQVVSKENVNPIDPITTTSIESGLTASQAFTFDNTLFNSSQLHKIVDEQISSLTSKVTPASLVITKAHLNEGNQITNALPEPSSSVHFLFRNLIQFHHFNSITMKNINQYELLIHRIGQSYQQAVIKNFGKCYVYGKLLPALFSNFSDKILKDFQLVLTDLNEFHYDRSFGKHKKADDLRERVLNCLIESTPIFSAFVLDYESNSSESAYCKAVDYRQMSETYKNVANYSLKNAVKPRILKQIAETKKRLTN